MTAFSEYAAHGWKLCSIDRMHKCPTYDDWNTRPIPDDAADGLDGAGLLHALSGTCALDIDSLTLAQPWLLERGVDVEALLKAPNAVRIDSGRYNRAKLLYALKRPLRSVRPKASGIELRCATADGNSVQDVLPPSIHPDTKKPYKWLFPEPLVGDWRKPPPLPAALLNLWRALTAGSGVLPVVPAGTPIERPRRAGGVDLAALRKATFRHDPNCEHDEWLKVGAQLHDGTGGAQEGLDIWDDWSKTATRDSYSKPGAPVYAGKDALLVRYQSFSSGPGKRIASGEALAAESPASADEFPMIAKAEADKPSVTGEQLEASARDRKKAAVKTLEKRLIFVTDAARYFDTERHKIIPTNDAIEHMFTHMMPRKNGSCVNPVKLLKESPNKQFVDHIGFHPGEGVTFKGGGESYANTYRPMLAAPLEPTKEEIEKIEWLFLRIRDEAYRKWLIQFFGHVVQRPGIKIKSAPLIWSDEQGNGKTTLLRMIPSLLVNQRYSREVTSSQLGDTFNGFLLDAWHVNLTEFRAGTRGERESVSKRVEPWIADDYITVRPMYQTAYTIPNHLIVTATSNAGDAASVNNRDRKWAIHELAAPQFTVSEQNWIYNEFLLTPRAAGVLTWYFMNVELSGFTASAKAIETDDKREMAEASNSADYDLLQIAFEERSGLFDRDVVVTQEATNFVHKNCPSRPSLHRVGKILRSAPINGKAIKFRVGEKTFRAIVIRNQKIWDGAAGIHIWNHINGEDIDITK